MQALVYIFIALAALGIGATAYFGLTFTPVEAVMAMIVFGCVAVVLLERTLRQRAEARLEKAIEDLSRLLSTDAQAGATLSQRVNRLADENSGKRLEMVEADISVLGTVIRQVAEAVAEIEDDRRAPPPQPYRPETFTEPRPRPVIVPPVIFAEPDQSPAPAEPEPVIPLELVRQAIAENRLVFHIQPVVTLPQRRTYGYDLLPRLMLEDGELAEGPDFIPRRNGDDVLIDIDGSALVEAITIGRRARTTGQPINLFVPLSRATLADRGAADQYLAVLEANRSLCESLILMMPDADWSALGHAERAIADLIARKGANFSIDRVQTLRRDVAELAGQGVHSLRIEARELIDHTNHYTDFHLSDIASYLTRFGVDLVVTAIASERQILELLEDGITMVQGSHIAAPGPVRHDLMSERPKSPAQLQRV